MKNTILTKEELQMRSRTAVLTFFITLVVILIKFWAFNLTHSQAVYSDALESVVNLITAFVGILVIYYAAKPVDEDHPYGHGKVEYFSAAFEGGLITFAAVFVFIEAVNAQLNRIPVRDMDRGMLLIGAAGLINLVLGLILKRVGKRHASLTLEAAGVHLVMDFWTTVGAMGGVFMVKITGFDWIDRVIALLLGTHMIIAGTQLVRTSLTGLLDAEDLQVLRRLAEIFGKHAGAGIIQIHHTKVIRSGWFHHIDAHIVVPEFWTIDQAHERLNVFEDKVIAEYEYSGEANFHVDPCRRKYCSVCDYADCSVRVAPFEKPLPVIIEHLRSKTEPDEISS